MKRLKGGRIQYLPEEVHDEAELMGVSKKDTLKMYEMCKSKFTNSKFGLVLIYGTNGNL